MNFCEKICHTAAPYRAVAFDVFGTLLRRDVGAPRDLFALRGQDFAAARAAAEAAARAAKKGEVTLADIYAQPPLAGEDPQAECGAELAAVTADPVLLHAARLCRARGQKVYAISDMYLPEEQISAMLHRCGYDFLDGVFVSSAYGVQKRSGRLFRVFLQKTGLTGGQVLFVGDDRRADSMGAALAGIRCLHRPPLSPLPYTPPQTELVPRACYAFTQNRNGSLGFETGGPLVTGFAQWLHLQRRAAPQARMLFLARDMELVLRVYRRLYPREGGIGYLKVSRQSLCPLLLAERRYPLLCDALPKQALTGEQIARYCGAEAPKAGAGQRFLLNSEAGRRAVLPFLQTLPIPQEKAAACRAYLAEQGIADGTLLVDIGSGGTTQKLLEALCGVTLQGLYLACDERLDHARAAVYLFEGQPAPLWYWMAQPLLERLISEPCGATAGYTLCHGRAEPVILPQKAEATAEEFRRGAMHYAAQWQASVLAGQCIPAGFAIQPFLQLMRSPQLEDARRLGALTLEDGGVYAAAAPRGWGHYLCHPGQYRKDLREACWKVGFLKQSLRLPLPYDRAYAAIKKQKGERHCDTVHQRNHAGL